MLRTLHLFLVLLLLAGSVGVTVNRHFCMGELKSLALFGAAEKCHAEQRRAHCPLHPPAPGTDEAAKKKGCCDDEHEYLQLDEDRELQSAPQLPPLAAIPPNLPPRVFSDLPPHLRHRPNGAAQHYRPPPLVVDAPRHWQVFRL